MFGIAFLSKTPQPWMHLGAIGLHQEDHILGDGPKTNKQMQFLNKRQLNLRNKINKIEAHPKGPEMFFGPFVHLSSIFPVAKGPIWDPQHGPLSGGLNFALEGSIPLRAEDDLGPASFWLPTRKRFPLKTAQVFLNLLWS